MFSVEEIEAAKQNGSTLLACDTYSSLRCNKTNGVSSWSIGIAHTYSLYLHMLNAVLFSRGYMANNCFCIQIVCVGELMRVFLTVPKMGRKRYLFTCSVNLSFATIMSLMAMLAVKYKSFIEN